MRYLFLLCFLATGCASTSYKKVELHDEDFAGTPLAVVNNVPFVEQTPKLCGPTALYMVTKKYRPDETLDEISKITMTPSASGTFKQDLLAAARRMGMAPYAINSLPEMIQSLSEGTPVIVFHRTKFLWKDYWHYSVLTGYNRLKETLSVHIGPYAYHDAEVSDMIGSWEEGGKWSYVVVPPEVLPPAAKVEEAVANGLSLLRLGNFDAAKAISQQMLKRWPNRYEADVMIAEVEMKNHEKKKALKSLRRALSKKPDHPTLKKRILELSKV